MSSSNVPRATHTLVRSFLAWCTCGSDRRRKLSFVTSPVSPRLSSSSSLAAAGYCSSASLLPAFLSVSCTSTTQTHTQKHIIIIIIHEYYYEGAVALLLQDHLTMNIYNRLNGYLPCLSTAYVTIYLVCLSSAFSALLLLVGRQEGYLA